jgi:hypothetical protein
MKVTSNYLRTFGLIISVLIFSLANLRAQSACPVNFIGKTLVTAKSDIDNWNGKIIACEVEVVQVEKGYVEKPYYKVKFEDSGQIWVGGLVTSGYEKVGTKLRLLGYFSKVENDDSALKFNKDGFHLLAFVVVDLATKQMSISTMPGAKEAAQEWINGSIPKGGK